MNQNSNNDSLRQQIRQQARARRKQLTYHQQQQEAVQLAQRLKSHPKLQQAKKVALYLANDGELDPALLIKQLWQQQKDVYLPTVHPFSPGNLLFLRYDANSTMISNKYGISEPKLDVSIVCPISELDVIFTPLVAFDSSGNRMGMGGGYYDRALCGWQQRRFPYPIGLAHDCQRFDTLPIEAWDIPLPEIITPSKQFHCSTRG